MPKPPSRPLVTTHRRRLPWRRAARPAGALLLLVSLLGAGACWRLAAAPYRAPADVVPPRSAHRYPPNFDGERFFNLDSTPDKPASALLRWQWERLGPGGRGEWRDWFDIPAHAAPPRRVTEGIGVTWVNHATVLVQLDGVNVLTDPIWSERASPVAFAGPRRHHAPGIVLDSLPPIDVIVVSHNHYDHMDLPTLRRLVQRDAPVIVVGLGNASYLAERGIAGAVDVNWGDTVGVDRRTGAASVDDGRRRLLITSVPARHWSARAGYDRRRTLWSGFVVEGPSGRVYFGGDTGYGTHFADASRRFGPFDLALLPIGAYEPRWFMRDHHMNPADAVRAACVLRAAVTLAIHHSTFRLTDEGQDDPVHDLRAALDEMRSRGARPPTFWVTAPGEPRILPGTPDRTAGSGCDALASERAGG